MKLDALHRGDCAKILKIECDEQLRHRLYSFGIVRGAQVKVVAFSIKKKTIEIALGRSKVALRIDEARKISVEKVEECQE